jgi:hypothetical protein
MPKKTPRINELLDNAVYVGKVTTKKTVYYVFQTQKDYLLFSFKDATYMSGNFNLVMADTVDRIYSAFKGQKRITRSEIESHPQMKKFVTGFEALQTLYVLVARKQASIDKRSLNRSMLFFNIKK